MPPVTETVNVNFRAERDLLEQFRQVVAGDERTVSADLRRYMRRRVDESESPENRSGRVHHDPTAS